MANRQLSDYQLKKFLSFKCILHKQNHVKKYNSNFKHKIINLKNKLKNPHKPQVCIYLNKVSFQEIVYVIEMSAEVFQK